MDRDGTFWNGARVPKLARSTENDASEAARSPVTSLVSVVGVLEQDGIGFGRALGIVISWSLHQSVVWAMIHCALSWFYVIYYIFTR